MFVGRYQPLHRGHIKLIRTVLDEGKNILVAIKDMDDKTKNPYSTEECKIMFYKEFEEEIASGRMLVMEVPNIMEVCYGRKVGYDIRQIGLDKETESISATKIREQMQ